MPGVGLRDVLPLAARQRALRHRHRRTMLDRPGPRCGSACVLLSTRCGAPGCCVWGGMIPFFHFTRPRSPMRQAGGEPFSNLSLTIRTLPRTCGSSTLSSRRSSGSWPRFTSLGHCLPSTRACMRLHRRYPSAPCLTPLRSIAPFAGLRAALARPGPVAHSAPYLRLRFDASNGLVREACRLCIHECVASEGVPWTVHAQLHTTTELPSGQCLASPRVRCHCGALALL